MKLEVLISCMGNHDTVIENTNLKSDAVVIDQCDVNQEIEKIMDDHTIRIFKTTERGLSNSRNMALEKALGEVCLIADDDECLDDEYVETICNAYEEIKDADIIAFRISNQPNYLKQEVQQLNKWTAMRISSWQITFKKESIIQSGVRFDPLLGAGSGNGAGEEVKFLRDCIQKGLKAYYVPKEIGEVAQTDSTWFEGFDEKFFYQRGTTTRYMLGLPVSLLYTFHYAIRKKKMYQNTISMKDAIKYTLRGIFANDITKQKRSQL